MKSDARAVVLQRGGGCSHVKEKGAFGRTGAETGFDQHMDQPCHTARILRGNLFGDLGMIESVRGGVLDGQELAGIGVVLYVAVSAYAQWVAGDESAPPAGHVESFAGRGQFQADVLRAG